MDTKQLRPIKGLPPLMAPSMTCSFIFKKLNRVLRTLDEDMQELQIITRMSADDLIANKDSIFLRFCQMLDKTSIFVGNVLE